MALDQAEHALASVHARRGRTRSWPPSARSRRSSATAGPPWRSGSWDTPTGRWNAADTGLRRAQDRLYSLASAQTVTAWIYQGRLEYELYAPVGRCSTIALATTQGFPYRVAVGRVLRGWALTAQGQSRDGIAEMRAGRRPAWRLGPGHDHRIPGPPRGCLQPRRPGRGGLRALDEALALVRDSSAVLRRGELHRLRGALLLETGRRTRGCRPRRRHCEAWTWRGARVRASAGAARAAPPGAAGGATRREPLTPERSSPETGRFTEGFTTRHDQAARTRVGAAPAAAP